MKRKGPPPTGEAEPKRQELSSEQMERARAIAIAQLVREIRILRAQIRRIDEQIAELEQDESDESDESDEQDEPVEEVQPVVLRRSSRTGVRNDPTVKPVLNFTANYAGIATKTQKQAVEQNMFFEQTAVLGVATNIDGNLKDYYELRQQVRDSYTYASGEKQDLSGWKQDSYYHPPYSNDQTLATKKAIQFTDEPGYSTDHKVAAGKWLTSYDVYFRWIVTPKYGDRQPWTSGTVHHSLRSPYNGGADGPVTVVVADDESWEVDLPDRPDD